MATPKNNDSKNNTVNNPTETKVKCPVCGTEFAIGKHEHKATNVTVIGKDSGLGTIYLPVSKRGEVLAKAGVDTSRYFSIELPNGGTQLMTYDENGIPVAVRSDDPIVQQIVSGGTVPNRSLFRRWVMSQMFHGLRFASLYYGDGFSGWLKSHGYKYQWKMIVEEFRVQARLNGRDNENFAARNRWFNKELAAEMAACHIEQMRRDASRRPNHKCKGVPYVHYDHYNYFVTDIEKKLITPMATMALRIHDAKTPQGLYEAVRDFAKAAHINVAGDFSMCARFKDAYKGMGAYATMQNLLRFHGCTFPKDNDFYKPRKSGLQMLEDAAVAYADEGWRLLGLMKQMLDENHIDIEAKMKEWREAKRRKNLR